MNGERGPSSGVDDRLAGTPRPSEASRIEAPELLALRAEYMRDLPVRIGALREAAARAEASGKRCEVADAWTLAHQLHGTAGCYGFLAVSLAAAAIERRLATMLDPRREATPEPWPEIAARLDDASVGATRPDARAPAGPPPPRAVSTSFERARLLVVDDDPEFLRFVRGIADEQLVEIVGAPTAAKALEKMEHLRVDAAMIDVMLEPKGVSFELAHRFAAAFGSSRLPIAFVSANGDIENRVAAIRAGGGLYVTKPLDEHAMGRVIRQLVAMRRTVSPRILVVDDDPAVAHRVAALLRHAGMLVSTHTESTLVLEALDKTRPDLLVLDLAMPGFSGLDLCRVVRATPRWQDLPVLLYSGSDDPIVRVEALRAGADDFILKSAPHDELVERVRTAVERAAAAKEAAGTDSLTGLWLRLRFMDELAVRLREARRHGRPLTVALLDLDHFKDVNDTHGHVAGDHVLAGFAKLLRCSFRTEDLRARWGGEEFIVALPGEGADAANDVLTRLLAELRVTDFVGEPGAAFHVSFSAGIASLPADGDSIESLIKTADRRLYHAKRAGKGRVVRGG